MAELPEVVQPHVHRIVDVDSHEMLPAELWVEAFGAVAGPLAQRFIDGRAPGDAGYWS